jgi:rubrerythrin
MSELSLELKKHLMIIQKNEITEYNVYRLLAKSIKDKNNSEVLERIGNDELEHFKFWKNYTNQDIKPNKIKIFFYVIIAKILGITFSIKLMEKGEQRAEKSYAEIQKYLPEANTILKE